MSAAHTEPSEKSSVDVAVDEVIDLRAALPTQALLPGVVDVPTSAACDVEIDPRRAHLNELLIVLRDGHGESAAISNARESLILMHMGLVEHIARKFRDRGEAIEDLVQVGMLALVKSAARFDAHRGVEFSTYATATITGEIKRHFRDRTWAVHVPRRMQELRQAVIAATEELTQMNGVVPSVEQIATLLNVTVEDVHEGRACARVYRAASLDALTEAGFEETFQAAEDDVALELVEVRHVVLPLLRRLPERERRILVLRYVHCWSQSAIADHIGVSQMHVSRLLARSLDRMREWLAA